MSEAYETPLVDLLLDIPETYRIEYPAAYDEDGNPIGYRLFPVGLLAHKAAKRIAELEAFRRAVVGWRENDWPSGFCRATADMVADKGRQEQQAESVGIEVCDEP